MNYQRFKLMIIYFILSLLLFFIASCERKDIKITETSHKITVITTLFPLYDFTKEIAKERANVILLLPPGIEPHSFNPRPSDIATIKKADIFIFTNIYMEPWAKDILKDSFDKQLLIIDSSKGIELIKGGNHHHKDHREPIFDPHIWLDLSKALRMIDNILEGLITKDPLNTEHYINNANQYKAKLMELDERFKKTLSTCKKNTFISGGHLSFSYLAKRYNLNYLAAYESLSPDAEPTPSQMLKIIGAMKKHGLNHIFTEELIEPRMAQMIAEETKAQILTLNAGHNISKDLFEKGVTFISLMEKNLQNLKIALQCQ